MSKWPWEWLEALSATLEHGSLSAASRVLGVAQPTVRRRVEALEAALGTALFLRGVNGLVPTDVALAMRPLAQAMEAHAQALVRAGSGAADEVQGVVRVTAPDVIGVHVLPSILATLATPRPAVELATRDTVDDLVRRDADIAVRAVASTQTALVARRVGVVPIVLAAAPTYLAARAAPRSFDDAEAHDWVVDDRRGAVTGALAEQGLFVERLSRVVRADNALAQLGAMQAGLGIGVCQGPLVQRLGLQRVFPDLSVPMPLWVVVHEDLRAIRRVRRLFDHLVAALTAYCETPPGSLPSTRGST
ncbi:MAG: LysR family transcriptional regulator [Myxococcota bacterium]